MRVLRFIWVVGAVALASALVWWVGQANRSTVTSVGSSTESAETLSGGRDSGRAAGGDHLMNGAPSLPARLSDRVQLIVASDVGTALSARIRAVHDLGPDLTHSESAALADYLRTHSLAEALRRDGENWLRNDILDKLEGQHTLPIGLVDLLVGIYQDRQQDVVMRDYAVQHIPPVYKKLSDQERVVLHTMLWQATDETDSTIAGTALLALLRISGTAEDVISRLPIAALSTSDRRSAGPSRPTPEIDLARLEATALRLASDKHCGELSQLTALSLCGRLRVAKALPLVTDVAQHGTDVSLRLAAIAALGDLGGPATVELLEELSLGTETRVRVAATSALERLKKRVGI